MPTGLRAARTPGTACPRYVNLPPIPRPFPAAAGPAAPPAADLDGLDDLWKGRPLDATLDCSDLDDLFSDDLGVRLQGHRELWCHPAVGVVTEPPGQFRQDGGAYSEAEEIDPPLASTLEIDPLLTFDGAMLPDSASQPHRYNECCGDDAWVPRHAPVDAAAEASRVSGPSTPIGAFARDLQRLSQDFQMLLAACAELKGSV